jgi:hypothetical protein
MKKGTKVLTFFVLGLVLTSLIIGLVGAADIAGATKSLIVGVSQGIKEALTPLFGEQEFMTRALFAILIFMIVYSIVSIIFTSSPGATWAIALIITAISMLGIPTDFLLAIRTEYGAMGAAILSIIPFMIMLVFTTKVGSLLVGRMLWIFFALYYFGILFYNFATNPNGFSLTAKENIPYLIALIAGIAMFIVLKTIRRALFEGKMGDVKESGRKIAKKANLLHKLQDTELNQSYGDDTGIS